MNATIYTQVRQGLAFAVLVCSALLLSLFSQAQTDSQGKLSQSNGNTLYAPNANASANLDQVRNGHPSSPISPATWVNGNVGASNSHFVEGYSIPYRVIMTGLPVNQPVWIELEFDAKQGGKNAIDFITHYNNLEPHNVYPTHNTPEIIDPTNWDTILYFSCRLLMPTLQPI